MNPLNTLIKHVLSYVIHLALVSVVAWAASHGFHISIPVLPTSLGTWGLFGFFRLLAHNIGRSWQSGSLESQLELAGKGFISQVINDFEKAAQGVGTKKAA